MNKLIKKTTSLNVRKVIIVLLATLFCSNIYGQLKLTLNVDPHPKPAIVEWASNPQTVIVSVQNTTTNDIDYKINVELQKDGKIVAKSNLNVTSSETIGASQVEIKFAEDAVPYESLDILDNSLKPTFLKTGKLKGGTYQLCVTLVDANNTQKVISNKECRIMTITEYEIPRLIFPLDKSVLISDKNLTFQWTPITPVYFGNVTYILRVCEVYQQQKPLNALLYNMPIIEEELRNMSSVFITPDKNLPENGKQYIWSVKAIDATSEETINPEKGQNGWTLPHTFIMNTSNTREKNTKGGGKKGKDTKTKGKKGDNKKTTDKGNGAGTKTKSNNGGNNGNPNSGTKGSKKGGFSKKPDKKKADKLGIISKHPAELIIPPTCECDLPFTTPKPEVKILNPANQYTRSIVGLGAYMHNYQLCNSTYASTDYEVHGTIKWCGEKIDDPISIGDIINEYNYDSSGIALGIKLKYIPEHVIVTFKIYSKITAKYVCEKIVNLSCPSPTPPINCGEITFATIADILGDSAVQIRDLSDPAPGSSLTISNRKWILEDGTTYENKDTFLHTFKETKVHNICLELMATNGTDSLGCSSCADFETGADCEANIDFNYTVSEGTVSLSDSSFSTYGATISNHTWIFDEKDTLYGDTTSYTFVSVGNHEVCETITVTDLGGGTCKKTICKTVKINSGCDCEIVGVDGATTSTSTFINGSFIHLANGLEMELTENPTGGNASLTGKGKVLIPWLAKTIDVEFSSIKVNNSNSLGSGQVKAQKYASAPSYPTNWGVSPPTGFVMDSTIIDDIWNYAEYVVSPKKVPLMFHNMNGRQLVYTAFVFNPDGNKFSAIARAEFDVGTNSQFALEGKDIAFNSGGPSMACGGTFEIAEPIDINYSTGGDGDAPPEWFRITLNKSGDGHIGTGVEWKSTCGQDLDWCFRLDVDFEMPRKWLLPLDDDGFSKVSTNAQTEVCDWNDWIIKLDLPRCEINNLNGTEMVITNLTYDHSLVRNADGMTFPSNFVGDDGVTFKGFWLEQAKVILPEGLTTFEDTTQRIEIALNNWIINKNSGVTGVALAANIINFPKANVADLGASIDTVAFKILNSTAEVAYLKGKIVLPISQVESSNALVYTAAFGSEDTSGIKGFKFTLKPDGDITGDIFAGATFTISESSNMNISVGYDQDIGEKNTKFNLLLTGEFATPDTITLLSGKQIYLDLETTFEDMGMTWNKKDKDFKFLLGTWALASPQKKLGKFPISLEKFGPLTKSPQGNELVRGGFKFDAVINLAKGKIGGRTTLGIIGAVEKMPGEPMKPKFKTIELSKIDIFANLAAVKMKGSIEFINGDPVYGDGVKGEISCNFNSIETEINAAAFFGNTSYGATERYRYWKVEALAILPPPGIPFLPGLNFRGFGLGAYRHMAADYSAVVVKPNMPTSNSTFSGATFTPDKSIAFGLKIKAVIATTPKEESFNGDVGISGEFLSGGGMSFLRFDGDFYVGAKLSERFDANKAFIIGNVFAEYDFVDKVFDMGASVFINKAPISTPTAVTLALHIDKPNNNWYFIAGTPSSPNRVKVLGITVDNYVEFGNQIEVPTGFMAATQAGYFAATGAYLPGAISPSVVDNPTTQTGKGFAFGIAVNLNKSFEKKISGKYYGYADMAAGAEVNLSMMQYNFSCGGYSPVGINGWYTKGSLCAYISAGCGIKKIKNGTVKKKWTLVEAGVGAWLSGSFPNPVYLEGGLDFHYELIGGLANGDFHADFEYGTECSGTPDLGNNSFSQGDAAADQVGDMIMHLSPKGNNIDTAQVLLAAYGFIPNEVFDVAEQQSDGTVETRTFQVKYTQKLEEKAGGTFMNKYIIAKGENAMGEYKFILKPPLVLMGAPPKKIAKKPGIIGGGTGSGMGVSKSPAKKGGKSGMTIIGKPLVILMPGALDPPPPLGNTLKRNTTYKFSATAKLYELVGGSWVLAKKNNGSTVTETMFKIFRTGAAEPIVAYGGAGKTK